MRIINIIILIGASVLSFFGCAPSIKTEIPIVSKVKDNQTIGVDSVEVLDVTFISKHSSDSYLITYHLKGNYTFRALSSRMLTGIKVEEIADSDFSKEIELTPVLSGAGKSNNAVSEYSFDFTNEYLLKVADATVAHNVKFICQDKEAILRLPALNKINN